MGPFDFAQGRLFAAKYTAQDDNVLDSRFRADSLLRVFWRQFPQARYSLAH
jgi:hypothetical protein